LWGSESATYKKTRRKKREKGETGDGLVEKDECKSERVPEDTIRKRKKLKQSET
jgi:hypothetical protein